MRTEIDPNECERLHEANWDRSQIDLSVNGPYATMFLYGMRGVVVNFGPFLSKERFAMESGLVDMLYFRICHEHIIFVAPVEGHRSGGRKLIIKRYLIRGRVHIIVTYYLRYDWL